MRERRGALMALLDRDAIPYDVRWAKRKYAATLRRLITTVRHPDRFIDDVRHRLPFRIHVVQTDNGAESPRLTSSWTRRHHRRHDPRLRGTGYAGQIIYVEYPSTNYNGFLAQIPPQIYQACVPVLMAYGAQKAPVFDVFRVAALPFGGNACAAGLLTTNANGSCNLHPTPAGHQLIVSIIAGVVPPRLDE